MPLQCGGAALLRMVSDRHLKWNGNWVMLPPTSAVVGLGGGANDQI
jgi:hypothetical protein